MGAAPPLCVELTTGKRNVVEAEESECPGCGSLEIVEIDGHVLPTYTKWVLMCRDCGHEWIESNAKAGRKAKRANRRTEAR